MTRTLSFHGATLAMATAAALLLLPSPSSAQDTADKVPEATEARAPALPPPTERHLLWREAQAAREAHIAVELKAFEDPALKQALAALEAKIAAAVRAVDPEYYAKLDRVRAARPVIDELWEDDDDPVASPDLDPTLKWVAEIGALERELKATYEGVVQAEPLASEIQAMFALAFAKMTEIDPETPARAARIEELERRLSSQR